MSLFYALTVLALQNFEGSSAALQAYSFHSNEKVFISVSLQNRLWSTTRSPRKRTKSADVNVPTSAPTEATVTTHKRWSLLLPSWLLSMRDYFLIPRSQKSLSLTRVNFTSDSRDTPKGSLKSGLFKTCRWSSSIIHFSPAFISDRKFKKKRKPLIKSTCIAVFQVFLPQSLSSGVVDGNIEHFWAAGTDAAKISWFDLAVATHSPFVYTFLNNPVFQGKPREIQSQVCSPHSLRGTSFIQLLPLDKRCFSWEEPLFPFPLFQKHSFWLKPG